MWSAAWPLILPIAFFLDQWRSLKIVERNTPAVYPLMLRLTIRAAFPVFILSFGAGLAVCGILRLRKSESRTWARAGLDLAFLGLLFVVPWMTATGIDPARRLNLLDLWIDHPSQASAIPAICAVLAGLTFWFSSREKRRLGAPA